MLIGKKHVCMLEHESSIPAMVPARHVLIMRTTSHALIMQIAEYVLELWAASLVLAMQIVFACIGLAR